MHVSKKCHIVVSQPTWVSGIMPLNLEKDKNDFFPNYPPRRIVLNSVNGGIYEIIKSNHPMSHVQ